MPPLALLLLATGLLAMAGITWLVLRIRGSEFRRDGRLSGPWRWRS